MMKKSLAVVLLGAGVFAAIAILGTPPSVRAKIGDTVDAPPDAVSQEVATALRVLVENTGEPMPVSVVFRVRGTEPEILFGDLIGYRHAGGFRAYSPTLPVQKIPRNRVTKVTPAQ